MALCNSCGGSDKALGCDGACTKCWDERFAVDDSVAYARGVAEDRIRYGAANVAWRDYLHALDRALALAGVQ